MEQRIQDATREAERLLDDLKNEGDVSEFLDLVLAIREVKRRVSDLVRDADRLAAEALEGIRKETIGRHYVEVRYSKQRRWTDADGLRSAVSRIARFDPETGEERSATDAVEILCAAYRCGGAEARTTWLTQHEIDPDEYSEGDYRPTVTITPVVPASDKGEQE